jgi:hypothetical protein
MYYFPEHWFGLPEPEGVKPVRAWGARAILRNECVRKPVKKKGRVVGCDQKLKVTFDLPADRSQYRGPDVTSAGARAFFKSVNTVGLPELRMGAGEDRPVPAGNDQYGLVANPREYYGYLYIVAWEK